MQISQIFSKLGEKEFRKIEEHNRQEVIGKNLDLVCPQTIEGEGPS